MTISIKELPDFEPTEYLFETFKDKGKERWEIYAWALREVMLKEGNLQPCDMSLKEKLQYEGFMQMNPKIKTPYYEEPAKEADIEENKHEGPANTEVELQNNK